MRRFMSALSSAAVLLLLALPAHGQDFRTGLDTFISGGYETALGVWTPLAEAGDVDAQFGLGDLYEGGYGVAPDLAEALRWYRMAAEQGDEDAQLTVGLRYYAGEGVAQDYVQAHMWFDLAAAQGQVDAANFMKIAAYLITPEDVSAARRMAREWWEAHQ